MTRYTGAILFATQMHDGQTRKGSNDPYVVHPIRVAKRLYDVGVKDEVIRAAAILHDTIEDTNATAKQIGDGFGDDVRQLVVEMTKYDDQTKREYIDSFRVKSYKAGLLKMADRIDNIMDMDYDPDYRRTYSIQGMQIVVAVMQNQRWSNAPEWAVRARDILVRQLTTLFLQYGTEGQA